MSCTDGYSNSNQTFELEKEKIYVENIKNFMKKQSKYLK
jgi:hypothetical protein